MATDKHGFRAGTVPGIRNASSFIRAIREFRGELRGVSNRLQPSLTRHGPRHQPRLHQTRQIRVHPRSSVVTLARSGAEAPQDPKAGQSKRRFGFGGFALGPSAVALRLLALAFLAFTGGALSRGGEAAPEKKLPLPGELWRIDGHTAFLIPATEPPAADRSKPWVWYAPTLPPYPGDAERWMFERFTRAGVAIAGIDVGESYGSPSGRAAFSALYAELTRQRGYSARPVLLGRSRGGLQLINWAADHPDQVAAFAGIYPVSNLASYPGLAKAAPAYALTEQQLTADLTRHNPVDRLAPLAAARVPLFAIHGDVDRLVPLEANSGPLRDRYTALGGTMTLIIPPGQGHSMWPGFFQNEELVAFVLKNAFRSTTP